MPPRAPPAAALLPAAALRTTGAHRRHQRAEAVRGAAARPFTGRQPALLAAVWALRGVGWLLRGLGAQAREILCLN